MSEHVQRGSRPLFVHLGKPPVLPPTGHVPEVGKLFVPGRTSWPQSVEFLSYDAGLELRLFLNRPRDAEVKAVQEGQVELAFTALEVVFFFLFRFGEELGWCPVPFTMHLVPLERRAVPPELSAPDSRLRVRVYLVNSKTGMLRVIRTVCLSPEMSRALREALVAHAGSPWLGVAEYRFWENEARNRYPKIDDWLAACPCRCIGSDE